jgi:hypothetical protein
VTTIRNQWLDDARTILHSIHAGSADWDSFTSAANEIVFMLNDCNYPVYLLSCFRSEYQPMPGTVIPRIDYFYSHLPLNVHMHIYINASHVDRTLLSMFTRIHRTPCPPILFAGTIDEALALVKNDKGE